MMEEVWTGDCVRMEDSLVLLCPPQFKKTVAFFGEDPAPMSTDEFFMIFDTFMTSFSVEYLSI